MLSIENAPGWNLMLQEFERRLKNVAPNCTIIAVDNVDGELQASLQNANSEAIELLKKFQTGSKQMCPLNGTPKPN